MAHTPQALADLHDVELAALSAAGDRRAFSILVRRHSASVRGLLRRLGADASSADDLAQDAFLAAFTACGDYRGEGGFGAWVGRIAARGYIRRIKRDARCKQELQMPESAEDEPPLTSGRLNARVDLDDALKTLSPAERLCISATHGAGFSQTELAQSLDLPLGTVKSHVRRGLEKLRLQLLSYEGDVDAHV